MYDIQKGEILIDDLPIQEYQLTSLRNKIAVVLQDPYLFNDSILNNVRMFNPDIAEETVIQAAKEIGIHDFIMQLENNYHYIIQERGSNLSSGQKQLIAFLRSYVHQPELFILDEATAMIDSQTEQLIQTALKKILHNRTAIIIAHRLSTIQMAHQIVVMHQGKIVEKGTHEELLQLNGHYAQIYEAQFETI
jgi:subfamily B ATP-binding cassette protein MsbA